ncbi:MAG: hypothetical protein OEZ06_13410 [Myxococcales bacterium]|nr:hypothetical protein [Myxococcales bacterium]
MALRAIGPLQGLPTGASTAGDGSSDAGGEEADPVETMDTPPEQPAPSPPPEPGFEDDAPLAESAVPPLPVLAVDACDHDLHEDASWLTHESEHFRFKYFPGTAAERDLETIESSREAAYEQIHQELGLQDEPSVTVHLSPSRSAASFHGVGVGVSYPSQGRYDVIYTGVEGSFERVRYGHELTHVLAAALPRDDSYPLPFLNEGLAELLDQSGRDHHLEYAQKLAANVETRTRMVELEKTDVWGSNYGRAGSLLRLLRDRHGMSAVVRLLAVTSVGWRSGCYFHAELGCISDEHQLRNLLDHGLRQVLELDWEQLQDQWRQPVEAALAGVTQVSARDRDAIAGILRVMDAAIGSDDAPLYRSTMEGFYCNWLDDRGRMELAARAVRAYGHTETRLVAAYPIGIKNFETAYAIASRSDANGALSMLGLHLERLEVGWRVTWGPDWY